MNEAEPGKVRFDPALRSWILSSYADVTAALRDPRLSAAGTDSGDTPAQAVRREASARVTSTDRLAVWRAGMEASARARAGSLPADQPIDLVAMFARPWSCELAMKVTGAVPVEADRLIRLARDIFMAAATATDAREKTPALNGTAELARALPGGDPAITVQAFVALTQTLPCLLASVWNELFHRPDLAQRMRSQAGIGPRAVEELLRLASPGRAVFRLAIDDIAIGDAYISAGDRVILMLAAANRDPARFTDPGAIDLSRSGQAHLAFGQGAHSCAGASIVRVAVASATTALLETTSAVQVVGPLAWVGGFAIRAPALLHVRLQRHQDPAFVEESDAV